MTQLSMEAKTQIKHTMPSDESTEKAKEKAIEINELSLDCHLSHATFACNVLLEKDRERLRTEMTKEIDEKIKVAKEEGNARKLKGLLQQKKEKYDTCQKLRIYVDYLENTICTAFTVCDRTKGMLVIWLPKKLLEESRKNGTYTDKVTELRKLMAHELGHAILHTKELVEMEDFWGSRNLKKDSPEEHEAKVFAKNLLKLRHARNKKLIEDGTIDYF